MNVAENRLLGHGNQAVRKIEGNQPNDCCWTFVHILAVIYLMGEIKGEGIKRWFIMVFYEVSLMPGENEDGECVGDCAHDTQGALQGIKKT